MRPGVFTILTVIRAILVANEALLQAAQLFMHMADGLQEALSGRAKETAQETREWDDVDESDDVEEHAVSVSDSDKGTQVE
ncbi:hypothetical protein VTI74DRAFT_2830 [Chaetomium olivicolor]